MLSDADVRTKKKKTASIAAAAAPTYSDASAWTNGGRGGLPVDTGTAPATGGVIVVSSLASGVGRGS